VGCSCVSLILQADPQPEMDADACISWLCQQEPPVLNNGASFMAWKKVNVDAADASVTSCITTVVSGQQKKNWESSMSCQSALKKGQEQVKGEPDLSNTTK
jgi:hypothetical protein